MRLAVAQTAPKVGDLRANLNRTRELVEEAIGASAKLIVFPELSLSGYLTDGDEGNPALAPTDPRLLAASNNPAGAAVLVCFPEVDGGVTYNSAALFLAGNCATCTAS